MAQKYMITETERNTHHHNSQIGKGKGKAWETISKPIVNRLLSGHFKLILSQGNSIFLNLLCMMIFTGKLTSERFIHR
jgi:hypothetical protein